MKSSTMRFLAVGLLLFGTGCGKDGTAKIRGEFEGNWQGPCSSNRYTVYRFDGSLLTIESNVFSDAGCTSPKSLRTRTAPYTITGESPDVPGAKMVSEVAGATYETPLTQAAVDSFNSTSFCGFTDWQLDVPQETTGLTCGGSQIPAAGSLRYNIFQLEAAGTLRSGAVSVTTMPTALTANVYTKF